MNEFFNQFHFLMPHWFALLIPAYAYLFWLHLRNNKIQGWDDIVDETMRQYVVQQQPDVKQQSLLVHALALFIAVFAISGPSWQKQPQPVFEDQSALIIALDLSRSMLAEDIKPNRLDRAKFIIDDVVNGADKTGQFSLIAFAQEAFVVTPFTTDKATLIHQLRSLDPKIMPFQGTNFADVISKAETLHTNNELKTSRLLIITDTLEGLDTKQIKSNKVNVSVLAISNKDGAPIPTGQGDFIKDSKNNIVISKLNPFAMNNIQSDSSILFRQLQNSDNDLAYLLPTYKAISNKEGQRESEIWVNQGHYFVWLLLPYFLMWFRKGLFYGLVFFVIPLPQADAFELPNWLLNKNQVAEKAYQNKQYKDASEQFLNPNWAATSLYQDGQYEKAEQMWSSQGTAQSDYNAGNAAAKLQQYEKAIEHYKSALEKQPNLDDAKANLKSVEEFLKQQKQQEQQQDGDKKDQENNKDKQSSDDNKQENQSDSDSQKQQNNGEDNQQKDEQPSRKQSDEQNKLDSEKQQESLDKEKEADDNNEEKQSKGSTEKDEKDPPEDEPKSEQEHQKTLEQQEQDDKEKNEEEKETAQQQLDLNKQRQLNKTEQWLQKIPDDPGGLLRRKFYYYSQQHDKRDSQQPW